MHADLHIAVLYPTRFLEGEDIANNFLFNADRFVIFGIDPCQFFYLLECPRLMPLPIYD